MVQCLFGRGHIEEVTEVGTIVEEKEGLVTTGEADGSHGPNHGPLREWPCLSQSRI